MKKYICVLLAVCLLMLSGCSAGTEVLTNDLYKILEKDGVYTMQLHDSAEYAGGVGSSQSAEEPYVIEFSSVAKMKETIEKGLFSTEQLAHIQKDFTKDKHGNIVICNTNKLYDVTLPNGVAARALHWNGDTYNFLLGEGILYFTSKELYDDYASECDVTSGNAKIISVNMIADRDAKEVIFESLLGEQKKAITYSFHSEQKSISIYEEYNLEESETVPYRIKFYGTMNGVYFTGFMYEFTERPSYEWVTSFGLKPYVETETE